MQHNKIEPEPAPDTGIKQGRWIEQIRRMRLEPGLKFSALTLGTYADGDGGDVHPGAARIAMDCGAGYSTVRRHLATLRRLGLIELVRRGNRKKGWVDLYRLAMPVDLEERLKLEGIDLPDPGEYSEMIRALNAANVSGQKDRAVRSVVGSALIQASAEPMGDPEGQTDPVALSHVSAEEPISAHLIPVQRSPKASAIPPIDTSPINQPPISVVADVRTDACGSREPGTNQDPIEIDVEKTNQPPTPPNAPAMPPAPCPAGCAKGYLLNGDTITRCHHCNQGTT